MTNLILSIFGTICIVSLVLYDFACLCKFLGKEKWIEFLWYQIFPNKEFNDKFFFTVGKMVLLNTSFMCYIISATLLQNIMFVRILIPFTPLFASLGIIKNLRK